MTLELVRGRVTDRIDTIIKFAKERLSQFFSFGDLFTNLDDAIRELILLVEQFSVDGADKKKLVLDAVLKFYDNVLAPIDLPYIPNIGVEPMIDAALRRVIEKYAGNLIDRIVDRFNKTKWPQAE